MQDALNMHAKVTDQWWGILNETSEGFLSLFSSTWQDSSLKEVMITSLSSVSCLRRHINYAVDRATLNKPRKQGDVSNAKVLDVISSSLAVHIKHGNCLLSEVSLQVILTTFREFLLLWYSGKLSLYAQYCVTFLVNFSNHSLDWTKDLLNIKLDEYGCSNLNGPTTRK